MSAVPYLRSRRKRALDVVVGGVVLVLAGPLLALAAVAIRLETHGHPVYRQRRVGRDGQGVQAVQVAHDGQRRRGDGQGPRGRRTANAQPSES